MQTAVIDTTDLSILTFRELEEKLRDHTGYPERPRLKAKLSAKPTAAEARAYADAVEEHEKAEATYNIEVRAYNDKQSLVQEAWSKKLRDEHSEVPEAVYWVLYGKAYDDGHSSGYSEVRNTLSDYVDFYHRIKEAEVK